MLGVGAAGAGLGLTAGAGSAAGAGRALASAAGASQAAFPQGAIVRTVLEDLSPDVLADGATLFHEHLAFNYASPPAEPRAPGTPEPAPPTNAEMVDLLVEELQMAKFDGVSCIVDSSVGPRTPQQLDNLRAMATRSDVHVVLGGSYFLQARYPEEIIAMPQEEITASMVGQAARERWGALGEVGSSFPAMHDDERKVIAATAQVHVQTGLPIFTHVPHESCPTCAIDQLDIYEAQGVDMAHLCIGHQSTIKRSDDATWETHKEIARRGAFVGFDTVGHRMSSSFIPERQKVDMVLNMIEAGYEDHVLLSADFANTTQIKANWGNGFSTVLIQFVPKLRYFGVPDETIHKILVDNSRRWLAYTPV
jgi:phosphotriesterase-related protein